MTRTPTYSIPSKFTLYNGDCLEVLRDLPDNSVDSICTDPPAGISFLGADWDKDKGGRDGWVKWMTDVATECLRVIKPNGLALVWAIPRTSHWTAMAWEDAGWACDDVVAHIFGSGFPKGFNISKAIDKLHGAERKIIGYKEGSPNVGKKGDGKVGYVPGIKVDLSKVNLTYAVTEAATEDAIKWSGWSTALKPAAEHWILLHKPSHDSLNSEAICAVYASKISRADRNYGLDHFEEPNMTVREAGGAQHTEGVKMAKNHHPTVKNTGLMLDLVRIVAIDGDIVLDPFMGSGSTGRACAMLGHEFVGIELNPEYVRISEARIRQASPFMAYDRYRDEQEQQDAQASMGGSTV